MAKSKIQDKKKVSPQKNLASEIAVLLNPVKEILKKGLAEKKIEKRIKKAIKLLVQGIKEATPEKPPVKKKTVKKAVKRKPAASVLKKPLTDKQAKPKKA